MSVINKMLRDLDARRGDTALPDLPRQARVAAMDGTASVMPASAQAPRTRRWLMLTLLLIGAGAVYWHFTRELGNSTVPPAPVKVALPVPASLPVPAEAPIAPASDAVPLASNAAVQPPIAAASVPTPASVAVPANQQLVAEPTPAPLKTQAPVAVAAEVSTPAATPPQGRVEASPAASLQAQAKPAGAVKDATPPRPAPSALADRPVPGPVPSVLAKPVQPVPAPQAQKSSGSALPLMPLQRRQAAAKETLARAQALWQAGSREAALDLLREARALTERSQPPDAVTLAMLVREQAQMELALGRPDAVLDLLTRLETVLSDQADLWAVRGNAAQRLGRHEESVFAYQAALKLRPDEPRWLLGAAVSLAALGQFEAAGQQAELARAAGPVSPEVLKYLRQVGVPLR